MDEIQKERGRELIDEFQRKFDLVRWGIWYTQTYENTGSSSLKENIRPCHEYYPIPDTQVVYSGYALDNKALMLTTVQLLLNNNLSRYSNHMKLNCLGITLFALMMSGSWLRIHVENMVFPAVVSARIPYSML